jgi:hypothetical protein
MAVKSTETAEEATASMEMAPGALSHPGRVPEQRLLSPKICRWRRRSCRTLSQKTLIDLGFSVPSTTRNQVYCNNSICGNKYQIMEICTYCHDMTFVAKRCESTHGNRLLPQKTKCGKKTRNCNDDVTSCHTFSCGSMRLLLQFGSWG